MTVMTMILETDNDQSFSMSYPTQNEKALGWLSALSTGLSLMLSGALFHLVLRDLPAEFSVPLTLMVAVASTLLFLKVFAVLLRAWKKVAYKGK